MMGPLLQYQSLKTVLLHMDANTRFQIGLHMPSIRSVEKMLPFKIHRLSVHDCTTKINDTTYRLGIVRHYPDGNAPELVRSQNGTGGIRIDFDEFGFEIIHKVLLPGDVSFRRNETIGESRKDTEADEIRFKQGLKVQEKAMEIATDLKSRGVDVKEHLKTLAPLSREQFFEEEGRVRQALTIYPPFYLARYVNYYKLLLLPFDCRRNKTKPPFKCYIQLTIEKGKSRQIHRFEYTKKLFEAAKHFNEVFFGGRTMPIQVGNLNLIGFDEICRLPIGFRFQVQKAHVSPWSVLHKSFDLLVGNSNSLDCVEIHYTNQLHEFRSHVVRNAKRVVIVGTFRRIMVQVLRELLNLEVSILPTTKNISAEEYFTWIQAWLTENRPVGASCWMRMGDEETAREVLKLVGTRNKRTIRNERCVIIRRNDHTIVEVFYDSFEADPSEKFHNRICNWIMKIRIVQV